MLSDLEDIGFSLNYVFCMIMLLFPINHVWIFVTPVNYMLKTFRGRFNITVSYERHGVWI